MIVIILLRYLALITDYFQVGYDLFQPWMAFIR